MCNYCETPTIGNLGSSMSAIIDNDDILVQIMPIMPIARRRRQSAKLQVYSSELLGQADIKYCPMCGKELK